MTYTCFLFLVYLCHFTNCINREENGKNTTTIPDGLSIDSLVIIKSERTLSVFSKTTKIKTYFIALGKNPVGKKQFEGDYKTPEGIYSIDAKSASSKYHKNLNISYPNEEDTKYAAAQQKRAGGEIKIHGLPNGYNEKNYIRYDWTHGCIGLTNSEIDELYKHIRIGSPVLILP